MTGETMIYNAKLHWIIFSRTVVLFIISLIMFIISRNDDVLISKGAIIIGTAVLVIAIISGIMSLIKYLTSEFGITNKRILIKIGFIRRSVFELLLTKVEGIQVHQGILGRLLGYGSIIVGGTGSSKEPFHTISAPLEFRKNVQEQIDSVQQ